MKIRISDMMDQIQCVTVELREQNHFSSQRVRERTLQKIHSTPLSTQLMKKIPRIGKISKMGIAVAALVFCISITAAAGIIIKWNGFAYTDGLNRREMRDLMREATTGYAGVMVDEADGSVHYLDKNGDEIMVLSAAEAEEYEAARQNAKDQAVIESTSLIDVTALPLIPGGITEMETDGSGEFADFMLGNGYMILLHPAGEDGYRLAKGDTITILLEANDKCRLEFRVYQDGVSIEEEVSVAEQHCYHFTAAEDGLYHFSAMYYSAGASMFKNCSVTVD